MADLFVSYSRVNRNRITGVGDAREENGHSVWWDRALAPGDDYAVLIEKEIDAARCGIVAWSKMARGPGSQGLGRVALLGWTSILVAALAALAVGMTGALSAAAFGGLTMFALAVAAILLAATAFSRVRIGRASRR